LIGRLRRHDAPHNRGGARRIVGHAILCSPQKDIAAAFAFDAGHKAPVGFQERDRDARFGASGHQSRGSAGAAKADNGLQHVQRGPSDFLAFRLDH